MSRHVFCLCVALALGLAGCSAMEQYHYMPAYHDVPVKVKLAFSEKYPNDVIKTELTMRQQMFDGTTRYRLVVTDSKNVQRDVVFTADGNEL